MGSAGPVPFALAPTAVVLHENNLSGWVEWDVTADVAQFLNGTQSNYGWIVRKDDEGQAGQVEYSSREGSFSPQLIITQGNGSPLPPNLSSIADTYLRQGTPNQNQGNETILQIQAAGNNRALLRFNQQAIAATVGTGTLLSAKLRLYIVFNANNWGPAGREVNVHRMTRAWTEQGATWNCPDDTNPFNSQPNCSSAWDMQKASQWPFVQTRTATVVHRNGDSGWVEWDVTPDVGLFLNGTAANHGWVIRKDNEGLSGQVEYSSREGRFPPHLVLTVGGVPNPPVISSILPNSGQQAQTLNVAVTGQFTHFVQGATTVSLGAGITVNSVTVTTATTLTANISIAGNATAGARTLTVTTAGEVASLANAFTVALGTPVLTLVNPNTGQQGKTLDVALTGQFTNFVQGATAVNFGAGVTMNTVTVTNATSLTANVSVAVNAAAGPRTVTATTGTEVASLANAFTVGAGSPVISLVNPNSGQQGQTLNVALTGQFTSFVQNTTVVSFGAGITVNSVTVTNPTSLTANISIAIGASAGSRTLSVTTGAEVVSLANGFTVAPASGPQISDFHPKTAPVGTLIAVTGTNLQPASGSPQVTLAAQAGGSMQAPVSSFTATSIQFVIPTGAATGPVTVRAGTQSASSATPLTVTPSSTFTLTALPASATAMPGQSVSYALSLASTTGFSQLASLALSGVPSGVTPNLQPAQITAGQTSVLTLQVPSGQPLASTSFSVSATAKVEGLPVLQSAVLQLTVVAASTSFVGRTVVDDALQTPIAGVSVKMSGKNGNGGNTGCSGSTISDAAGNFALTGLGPECVGQQLVGYDGLTATSPEGDYAGVDLAYTLIAGQVTASPVLVHLPRIDGRETFNVQQNSTADQTYAFATIPGVSVTVYAGTTFTMPDGSTPNPFPLVGIQVPIDRLPETMPFSPNSLNAFIVAFQPANAHTNKPVAVSYPNTLNTPPGTNMPLMTLDPTRGRMVPYGTATVAPNGKQIVPDLDAAFPGQRYGIVNFDWHGPAPTPQPPDQEPRPPCQPSTQECNSCPCPEPACQTEGQPVELASGRETVTATDIAISGGRGSVSIVRNYRSLSTFAGPFGIGTNHNFGYLLDQVAPQNALTVNLILPEGNRFPFSRANTTLPFTNVTIPALRGVVLTAFPDGHAEVRWKDGRVFRFAPSGQILPALESMTDANGNKVTLTRNPGNPVQITQITDPVGRSLNLSYDGATRITNISDPIGRTVQYSYNAQGTLERVTDPEGGVTRYEYDAQNRMTRHIDPRNVTLAQNTYNANGHIAQQTQADGGVLRFNYTLMNPVAPNSPITSTTFTNAAGRTTSYRFDALGLLTDVRDNDGQTRLIIRSPESNNQVVAHQGTGSCATCGTSSAGDQSFRYDANGNVIEQTDALGNKTLFTYEPVFNKVASIRDALNNTTSFTYDTRGNLLTRTDANQKTIVSVRRHRSADGNH